MNVGLSPSRRWPWAKCSVNFSTRSLSFILAGIGSRRRSMRSVMVCLSTWSWCSFSVMRKALSTRSPYRPRSPRSVGITAAMLSLQSSTKGLRYPKFSSMALFTAFSTLAWMIGCSFSGARAAATASATRPSMLMSMFMVLPRLGWLPLGSTPARGYAPVGAAEECSRKRSGKGRRKAQLGPGLSVLTSALCR